jgi:hypothetical protein
MLLWPLGHRNERDRTWFIIKIGALGGALRRQKLTGGNCNWVLPEGEKTLGELFVGRSQLLVYHFMFGPEWTEGVSLLFASCR